MIYEQDSAAEQYALGPVLSGTITNVKAPLDKYFWTEEPLEIVSTAS